MSRYNFCNSFRNDLNKSLNAKRKQINNDIKAEIKTATNPNQIKLINEVENVKNK